MKFEDNFFVYIPGGVEKVILSSNLRSNNYLQLSRGNVLASIMLLRGCIVIYTG